MSGDANYPSVGMLLTFESSITGDTSPSPVTVTANGGMGTSGAFKWGAAGAFFDGSNDYLSAAIAAIHRFAGDFTVEMWVKTATLTGSHVIYDCRATAGSATGFALYQSTQALQVYSNNAGQFTSGNVITSTAVWYHIAFSRASGVARLFVDGTQVGSNWSTAANFSDGVMNIGRDAPGNSQFWSGSMDDVRVTPTVGRYTANFTAPTAQHPAYAGQISGVVRDDVSALVARSVRAYRRDTGALVGSTTSSAVDGTYSMNIARLDECTVVCLDNAGGTTQNDLCHRVVPA